VRHPCGTWVFQCPGGEAPVHPAYTGSRKGEPATFLGRLRRRQHWNIQEATRRSTKPPRPAESPMTRDLWSWIQDDTSFPKEEPLQTPLLHLPPEPQGVPSRKFCCMAEHVLGGNDGDEHDSVQELLSHAYVSLLPIRLPMSVRHCESLLVH